ncbi:Tyrosyl-DNA phosphodiesterase I [Parasponia andersonii]|uniref:Tyrosyl-DNA phosphodiesterase I n=1 Tax=Parasponia andersonii TaxID=3476 RepID=A0A2P5DDB3_PARAD|nr:Tyrosyl-DNA phosphodiesterase I [Parasponia andersonii]
MEDLCVSDDNSSLFSSSSSKSNKRRRGGRRRVAEEGDRHCRKKCRRSIVLVELKHFDLPLLSTTTASPADVIRLLPYRPYSIGRSPRHSDFLFHDRRVGRRHCQIFFDPLLRKLYLLDAGFDSDNAALQVRASLNGVFVNGFRIKSGMALELSVGDEVSLVCAKQSHCRVGFAVQRIVFEEKLLAMSAEIESRRSQSQSQSQSQYSQGPVPSQKGNKRVFASKVCDSDDDTAAVSKCEDLIARANCLLSHCKHILLSDDPVSCIRATTVPTCQPEGSLLCPLDHKLGSEGASPVLPSSSPVVRHCEKEVVSEPNGNLANVCATGDSLSRQNSGLFCSGTATGDSNLEKSLINNVAKDFSMCSGGVVKTKISARGCTGEPPGKGFHLNRLGFMDDSFSGHPTDTSLRELLHPVGSIYQIFIATFTTDILWFLSFCEIPRHLPVTIACHNTERCWNSSPDCRTSVPYPDFPNLVVVYPPFPEDIAFGKDLKKQGIGCHHPKLIVLQRDDFLRVIVTSANLVPTQWTAVTNTIWWQDFPHKSAPDYMSLFTQIHGPEVNQDSKSDFCSQLAGFMACLLTDVPNKAHWIVELTKYDFKEATGYLVASVPGIHSYRPPNIFPSTHFLQGASAPSGLKFLGSVEASVVGLSYLFHNAADSSGARLKKLASVLGKSCEHTHDFTKVVLIRNKNVLADENAVSIFVPSPNEFSSEDHVQLGFLPRKVAKWVSPLWDIGFFRFSAYVCQKQALTAALGGSNKKVPLFIHGPNFEDIPMLIQPKHVDALCSMIAAIQRCSGLWRLQEVLAQYKWPEELESDFIYSASSIGSIDARFLAAFSAAAGKTSLQFDSEESDPEWGCWSASQELKNPSIRIIFPSINRVQNAHNGVLPSKRVLCFAERTWERLRTINILHDAIPYPSNRVGHPMHIKVARRCFKSGRGVSSFGWVYCGSHNFSAAAWGRPVFNSFGTKADQEGRPKSSLGQRLRVCNYELGIIFIFAPTKTKDSAASGSNGNLDGIVLPFVVPAPKYGMRDRPATAKAMREVLAALTEKERKTDVEVEEVPDEDESAQETDFVAEEKEEENAYAEILWNQVDSS